jgi:hypothetical protein
MVDGVTNKANVRFCRLAWWYSFPRSRCSVWISLASARSRLHLWHGPYGCSHHAGCRRDLAASAAWQIGHTAGTISAAPQDVAFAAQLQAWMLTRVFGEHVRTISEHFWIDGGAKCGEGATTLLWSRPDRAASCCSGGSAEAVPFPSIAGRSTPLLRFSRRKESDEVGHE